MKTSCNVQPSYQSMLWSNEESFDYGAGEDQQKEGRHHAGRIPRRRIRGAHRAAASRSGGRRVAGLGRPELQKAASMELASHFSMRIPIASRPMTPRRRPMKQNPRA